VTCVKLLISTNPREINGCESPGQAADESVAFPNTLYAAGITGRRVAYTSPIWIYIVISLVYFVIALHTFYRESWPKSILKFFALQLIFLPILAITIELASHIP